MYAIVNHNGKQYKVQEGEEMLLDLVLGADKIIEVPDVSLVAEGDKITLGTPFISGAKVVFEVLGDEKGDKVRVVKYKAKSRYRKVRGFRPQYTRVKVQKINLK